MRAIFSIIISILILGSCRAISSSTPETLPPSQGIELRGALVIPQSGKLFFWSTYGRQVIVIDSTQIVNGAFDFGKKKLQTGVYMLGTNENNMCPILINEQDTLCIVGFKNGKLETSGYSVSSKENEGWFEYLSKEQEFLRSIQDAKRAAVKAPEQKELFLQQEEKKKNELLNYQNGLISRYQGTFFAQLLHWKQELYPHDFSKYWDNIDFKDERITRSKVLSERIESYMRTFSGGETSGFIRCVDSLAHKAKADDNVLEFTLTQMLIGFYESGLENICNYLIDNYINGEACGDADLSQTIKNTAEGISRLGVGHIPPNIVMRGIDEKEVNLYSLAASGSYTLVMFWSSWCEHCKVEAPQVIKAFTVWKNKGFDILGVSIDSNENSWHQAVSDRGFTFTNVCGKNQYRSVVAQDYRVTRTPTYFLLNHKSEIVLKPKNIQEVEKFLKTELK